MNVLNNKCVMAVLVVGLTTALYGCQSESESAAGAVGKTTAEAASQAPAPGPQAAASIATAVEAFQAEQRGSLTCNLDSVSNQPASGAIHLTKTGPAVFGGWAFGAASAADAAAIVLAGPAGSFAAKADVGGARPDVAQAYGAPQELNSGFNAVVDISAVPAGEYNAWFTRGAGASEMTCDLKSKVVVDG